MAMYTCPYCFSEHRMSDVKFRCINRQGFCGNEPDFLLTQFEGGDGDNPLMENRIYDYSRSGFGFIANHFMPVEAKCPVCKDKSSWRICPDCHNTLPPNIAENENMIISIVGSRASGKSHYIGVLIDELQRRVIPDMLGGNFSETDKSIRERYMEKYYYPLYQLHQSLKLTNPNEKQKPLIYETQNLNGNGKKLTFIFYDTAGENYEDLLKMTTVNRYICKSSGIIFLVDPSQVAEIRDNMDEEKLKQSCNISWAEIAKSTPDAIISRVASLIRQYKGMRDTRKIDIPVAVAFSKLDAITELLPKGSTVSQASNILKTGQYDGEELRIIDEEMRSFLNTWGERRLTTAVKNNFSNVAYFGLSALGESPINNNMPGGARRIQNPMPHRVADPFLWILHKNKVIR